MSKNFNGSTDEIAVPTGTIAVLPTTIVAWVRGETRGEGNLGAVLHCASTGGGTILRFANTGTNQWHFIIERVDGITDHSALTTDNAVPFNVWTLVAGSFVAGDGGPRIWLGDLDTPMAEASYTTRANAAGGTSDDNITNVEIGENAGNGHFDGDIAHLSIWEGVLSLDELNMLRIFPYAPMHKFSGKTLKAYWPLWESAAATALDHTGNGWNGTVTGTAVAEEPPFAFTRRGLRPAIVTPAAGWGRLLGQQRNRLVGV